MYRKIRENGEWDMQIYEEYPCESKTQMRIREEEVRIELRADLNEVRCYVSEEKKKELIKKHYEENKELIKEKRRDRYQSKTREKECEYAKNWYKNNRERKLAYQRQRDIDKKNEKLNSSSDDSSSDSSENEVIN